MEKDRGKYVTRAAFAKMQGERDRLKKDLYTIVMGNTFEAIRIRMKWKKEFEKDKQFKGWFADLLKVLQNVEKPKKSGG